MYSTKGNILRTLFAHLGVSASPVDLQHIKNIVELIRLNQIDLDLRRFGSKSDGGYLIPACIEEIDLCISPGVSNNCSFENDIFEKFGCKVVLVDPTINSLPRTKFEPIFIPKYLGITSHNAISIETILEIYAHNSRSIILQCDIEGAEWSSLLSCSHDSLSRLNIIVVEFHYFDKVLDPLTGSIFFDLFTKLFSHFNIVHIHPNNTVSPIVINDSHIYPVFEATFINKKLPMSLSKLRKFGPHPLDADCDNSKKPIYLHSSYINA